MSIAEIPGLDLALKADIYEHCFSVVDREVGGVLIGTLDAGSPPSVEASIRAVQADETAAQLTFTQDTWEHIHRALEENHPDQQIVGWYHTHPGYGVFLSDQDLFIHRNFFQHRSQIALVVDPLAKEEGVFAWAGDDVELVLPRRGTAHKDSGMARSTRSRRSPGSTQSTSHLPGPATSPPSRSKGSRLAMASWSVQPIPATTWIYLAVVAISLLTILWELFD